MWCFINTNYINIFFLAYSLNRRYRYRSSVGEDPNLIDDVHTMFHKLDLNFNGVSQIDNEIRITYLLFIINIFKILYDKMIFFELSYRWHISKMPKKV